MNKEEMERKVLRAIAFTCSVADGLEEYIDNPDRFEDDFLEKIQGDAEEVRKTLRLILKEIK